MKRIVTVVAVVAFFLSWPVAAKEQEGGLTVTEYGVGTAVVERQLEGEGGSFPEGGMVYFLTRVVGGQSGDMIQHVWIHDGEERVKIDLSIGGSHWRTFSEKTLHTGMTGEWSVEARDMAGNVLATSTFVCEPASGE